MNRVNFQTSLLLAPLAYAIHHFEEHMVFNFRDWRLQYFSDNNPLSTEAVFVVLTAITLTYIILHALVANKASARSAILFLMTTQVANAIFHTGGSVVFAHFSPGLITALLLYLPVNVFIAYQALREEWISRQGLLALFLLGNVVFWLFELYGPAPLAIMLIATYAWIGYETLQQGKASQQAASSGV